MADRALIPKLIVRVRFPSPAPRNPRSVTMSLRCLSHPFIVDLHRPLAASAGSPRQAREVGTGDRGVGLLPSRVDEVRVGDVRAGGGPLAGGVRSKS
jgi:hypothetical protein